MDNRVKIKILEIEKFYKIQIIFIKKPDWLGLENHWDNIIYINNNLKYNYTRLMSTVIHDVGHIYCYRNGLFKNFHTKKLFIEDLNPQEKKAYCLIALKAERYIDRWAMKELKKWDINLTYFANYYESNYCIESLRKRLNNIMNKI